MVFPDNLATMLFALFFSLQAIGYGLVGRAWGGPVLIILLALAARVWQASPADVWRFLGIPALITTVIAVPLLGLVQKVTAENRRASWGVRIVLLLAGILITVLMIRR